MRPRFSIALSAAVALAALAGSVPGIAAFEPPGTVVTIAGTGTPGYSGDGGPATQARLNQPLNVAFDPAGNLFIAEMGNARVRKIDAQGIITTVAGSGTPGYSGDGGPATEARLAAPLRLAFDRAGNLFIADIGSHTVRKVGTDGIIHTVAGAGKPGFSGDGGPAVEALLNTPAGLAADDSGNLFVADNANHRVRKIDAQGMITTIAGTGRRGSAGDGGPATAAQLLEPSCMAIDAAGNLYIPERYGYRVRRVDRQGIITTVAGIGRAGYAGDGGPATQARLSTVVGVAVDSVGNLFIADWGNRRVRKVDTNGIISTVVGSGRGPFRGEGGPAISAGLSGPNGVAIDALGNLFVANSGFHRTTADERVLKVFGIAAPGLLAGLPFQNP